MSSPRPDALLVAAAQGLLAAAQPAVDPLLVDLREALDGVPVDEAVALLEAEQQRLLRSAPAELAPVLDLVRARLLLEARTPSARQHGLERLVAWSTVLLTAERQLDVRASGPGALTAALQRAVTAPEPVSDS